MDTRNTRQPHVITIDVSRAGLPLEALAIIARDQEEAVRIAAGILHIDNEDCAAISGLRLRFGQTLRRVA